MKTYLTQTKYKTFKYVRRVPKQLLKYTSISTFRASLGTHQLEATQTAISYNISIDEALQLHELQMPTTMIIEKLQSLLPKLDEVNSELDAPIKGLFKDLVSEYLSSQIDNISADETRDKRYFYEEVCPSIFKFIGLDENPTLELLNYNKLLEFKNIVTSLPKRNIHKYRSMNFPDILKNLKEVEEKDLLSSRTVNKYIKWLRALFNFAVMLNHIPVNLVNSLPLQKTLDDKLQRLPLSNAEIIQLYDKIPQKMQYLLKTLTLTGMRLSELYKCTVVEIDGTPCYSLTDRSIKLKTKSSYRIIPVHKDLLNEIDELKIYRSKISAENLAKVTSSTIKKLEFTDKDKKSLYSLRHTFATELIQSGADTAIVSELLGHAHSTMTLSRYSTGFSVKQLKEVVELL